MCVHVCAGASKAVVHATCGDARRRASQAACTAALSVAGSGCEGRCRETEPLKKKRPWASELPVVGCQIWGNSRKREIDAYAKESQKASKP